ncbi:hypothetical protein [Aliidiomarina sanyensis]|uniref:Uncharacterized protein n=1 Tax=Aliidiomarina sanyensis TaxID=1249555 RepID=A0A432WNQ8_9GAMM|nr:hypothetical protein [Aliidiomarina sanyensis]RUO35414.1 hypothetical protein CWE11_05230 [Aliidiomarina sanyensis]
MRFVVMCVVALALMGCEFRRIGGPEFVVSSIVAGEGELSPRSASVRDGTRAEFEASPANGWVLESVTGCNGTLTGNQYVTGRIRNDCTIRVTFVEASGWSSVTLVLPDGTVVREVRL